jgi:hypothetical protein
VTVELGGYARRAPALEVGGRAIDAKLLLIDG